MLRLGRASIAREAALRETSDLAAIQRERIGSWTETIL
jgi:hypothetical protein